MQEPGPSQAQGEPQPASAALEAVREPVNVFLERFLGDRRAELAAVAPDAVDLVDEIVRLVRAGGKRLRPALCSWAYRAAGGAQAGSIVRAGAALELLHTSAIVHDDLMDRSAERRGVPAAHVRFAAAAPPGTDPTLFGVASAILVGDLAVVLSEQALRTSGFAGDALGRAMARFDRMRIEMAAGQYLDVSGSRDRPRVSALKSGSYTSEGPVRIACAFAEAAPAVEGALRIYALLVGEAFQLRDDVLDGDRAPRAALEVGRLIDRATRALEGVPLEPDAGAALAELAGSLRLPEAG